MDALNVSSTVTLQGYGISWSLVQGYANGGLCTGTGGARMRGRRRTRRFRHGRPHIRQLSNGPGPAAGSPCCCDAALGFEMRAGTATAGAAAALARALELQLHQVASSLPGGAACLASASSPGVSALWGRWPRRHAGPTATSILLVVVLACSCHMTWPASSNQDGNLRLPFAPV
jgi:hypothetical protein